MEARLTRQIVNSALKANCYRLRSWILWVLMLLVFVSGLAVVCVKNAYRQNFIRYQAQKVRARQLHQQWNQLLLEDTAWGSYSRIERMAQEDMGMLTPPASATRILTLPAQVVGATSAVGDNVSELPRNSQINATTAQK